MIKKNAVRCKLMRGMQKLYESREESTLNKNGGNVKEDHSRGQVRGSIFSVFETDETTSTVCCGKERNFQMQMHWFGQREMRLCVGQIVPIRKKQNNKTRSQNYPTNQQKKNMNQHGSKQVGKIGNLVGKKHFSATMKHKNCTRASANS